MVTLCSNRRGLAAEKKGRAVQTWSVENRRVDLTVSRPRAAQVVDCDMKRHEVKCVTPALAMLCSNCFFCGDTFSARRVRYLGLGQDEGVAFRTGNTGIAGLAGPVGGLAVSKQRSGVDAHSAQTGMLTDAALSSGRAARRARTGVLMEARSCCGRAVNGGCDSTKAVTPGTPQSSARGGNNNSRTLGVTRSSGPCEEKRGVAGR